MTCTNKVLACAAAAVVFSSSIRAMADEPAHAPPPQRFGGSFAGFARR